MLYFILFLCVSGFTHSCRRTTIGGRPRWKSLDLSKTLLRRPSLERYDSVTSIVDDRVEFLKILKYEYSRGMEEVLYPMGFLEDRDYKIVFTGPLAYDIVPKHGGLDVHIGTDTKFIYPMATTLADAKFGIQETSSGSLIIKREVAGVPLEITISTNSRETSFHQDILDRYVAGRAPPGIDLQKVLNDVFFWYNDPKKALPAASPEGLALLVSQWATETYPRSLDIPANFERNYDTVLSSFYNYLNRRTSGEGCEQIPVSTLTDTAEVRRREALAFLSSDDAGAIRQAAKDEVASRTVEAVQEVPRDSMAAYAAKVRHSISDKVRAFVRNADISYEQVRKSMASFHDVELKKHIRESWREKIHFASTADRTLKDVNRWLSELVTVGSVEGARSRFLGKQKEVFEGIVTSIEKLLDRKAVDKATLQDLHAMQAKAKETGSSISKWIAKVEKRALSLRERTDEVFNDLEGWSIQDREEVLKPLVDRVGSEEAVRQLAKDLHVLVLEAAQNVEKAHFGFQLDLKRVIERKANYLLVKELQHQLNSKITRINAMNDGSLTFFPTNRIQKLESFAAKPIKNMSSKMLKKRLNLANDIYEQLHARLLADVEIAALMKMDGVPSPSGSAKDAIKSVVEQLKRSPSKSAQQLGNSLGALVQKTRLASTARIFARRRMRRATRTLKNMTIKVKKDRRVFSELNSAFETRVKGLVEDFKSLKTKAHGRSVEGKIDAHIHGAEKMLEQMAENILTYDIDKGLKAMRRFKAELHTYRLEIEALPRELAQHLGTYRKDVDTAIKEFVENFRVATIGGDTDLLSGKGKIYRSGAPHYRRGNQGKDETISITQADIDLLKKNYPDIGQIASLSSKEYTPESLELMDRAGIIFGHFAVKDFGHPTPEMLRDIVNFMEYGQLNDVSTLVHCGFGEGRTGTAMAAYEAYKAIEALSPNLSYKDFMLYIKERAMPGFENRHGIETSIQSYVVQLYASRRLKKKGIDVPDSELLIDGFSSDQVADLVKSLDGLSEGGYADSYMTY